MKIMSLFPTAQDQKHFGDCQRSLAREHRWRLQIEEECTSRTKGPSQKARLLSECLKDLSMRGSGLGFREDGRVWGTGFLFLGFQSLVFGGASFGGTMLEVWGPGLGGTMFGF